MNRRQSFVTQDESERAFLVGVDSKTPANGRGIAASLEELCYLAQTAGATVVGTLTQKLTSPSARYYLGKGKLKELVELKAQKQYSLVIFDGELSPQQQRNLEEALQTKVIDRTALILDIFAKHAQTREGQLQVELAQHQYLLPRLAGQWSHLEQLGGGIGTRGPGESQLETDRRLIRGRIQRLRSKINQVKRHRALYRQQRKKGGVPTVALVGYTNSGKSTLLNALSKANVLVEDKLFSTLDPVTRRIILPDNQRFLLTDTVGFIHKLPVSIVAAFRATLEELEEADLLLHIVDITHPNAAEQCQTVEKILADLNLNKTPEITVFNKLDLILESEAELKALSTISYSEKQINLSEAPMVLISASKRWGMSELLNKIATHLSLKRVDNRT